LRDELKEGLHFIGLDEKFEEKPVKVWSNGKVVTEEEEKEIQLEAILKKEKEEKER
jgi:hypothetical protein